MMARAPLARLSPVQYYAQPAVSARLLEYCGGSPSDTSAAFVAALSATQGPMPTWDEAPRMPVSAIHSALAAGADISRSLWDARSLLFVLDLDYENTDVPAEPFLRPADVFLKLEPVYRAARAILLESGLTPIVIMTGRGYHVAARVALDDPLVDQLATLVPGTPAWFSGVETRRPAGVTIPLSRRQARAATGLGCLTEFVAHRILERTRTSRVPVVLNGTAVGRTGLVGREALSIDFTHAGDPLDVRHVRAAFSTYQWHRLRPDIFGRDVATTIEPVAAIPRGSQPLIGMLDGRRSLAAAAREARHAHASPPEGSAGLSRILEAYTKSPLAAFHRQFYADLAQAHNGIEPPRLDALPPCVAAPLRWPNDLLLKPEHVQHLVRALMSRHWTPARIARLIQAFYETDYGWGDRWTRRMNARTRAEFDVRVFAGLIATGLDGLVDFNCVSAQEKNLCPMTDCRYDLRIDRDRLASERA